ARLQLAAQLAEVVDLAVEDQPHLAVLAGHRLFAAGEIDDRQAPEAERHSGLEVHAVAVGPAVRERARHALDLVARDGTPAAAPVEDRREAAHAAGEYSPRPCTPRA